MPIIGGVSYDVQGDTLVSVTPDNLVSYDLSSLAITTIGDSVFYNSTDLTSVVFPSSLTTIGREVFNCPNLTSIVFPSSLTTIGENAFNCPNLTSVVFPSSLTTIGARAFSRAGIINLDLSGTGITALVTSGGEPIFKRSTLKTVNLSNTLHLNTIETTFSYCPNLETVNLTGSSLTTIVDFAFYSCPNLTSVALPTGLTTIGTGAFYATGIVDLDLSGTSITQLVTNASGMSIFNPPTLKTVNLSNTLHLDTIGDSFKNCPNLESVNLTGSSLTTIGSNAFSNSPKLNSVLFPSVLATIQTNAFNGCTSLLSVKVPPATVIQSGAFPSSTTITRLKSLTITPTMANYYTGNPSTPTSTVIGDLTDTITYTYKYNGSTTIPTVPATYTLSVIATVANAGNYIITYNTSTFTVSAISYNIQGTTLVSVSPTNLGTYDLSSLAITTIGQSVFFNFTNLASITFPTSLTTIGWSAFYGCTNLTSVTFPSSLETIGHDAFDRTGIINLDLSNTKIAQLVTRSGISIFNRATLKTLNLSNTVNLNTIEITFAYCPNLETVNLTGSGLTTLNTSAFYNCSKLNSILFPSGLATIQTNALTGCTSLLSVKVPSATVIQSGAFPSSTTITRLKSLTITPTMTNYYVGNPSTPTSTVIGNLTDTITYTYQYDESSTIPTVPGTYTLSVSATVANAENYAIIYNTSTFTVLPLIQITITPTMANYYIGSPSTPTSTVIGNLVDDITYTYQYGVSSTKPTTPGTYNLSVSATVANAANYDITYNTSTFTVLLIPLTITPTMANYAPGYPSTPTSTVIGDLTDTITYTYQYGESSTIPSVPDTYTLSVSATVANAEKYDITYNTSTFTVLPLIQITITPTMANYYVGNPSTPTSTVIGNLVDDITYTYQYGVSSTKPTTPGTYNLSVSATVANAGNYIITYNTSTFTVSAISYNIQGDTLVSASPNNLGSYDLSSLAITTIGANAFTNFTNLSSVVFPSSLTTIGRYGFSSCPNLTSVSFPSALATIGVNAFYNDGIVDLDLSGTKISQLLTSGGSPIFNRATLKTVNLSNTVNLNNIETSFSYCPNLESVNLTGSKITTLATNTFSGCPKLNSILFPSVLATIQTNAFADCTSLLSVKVPSATVINTGAFPSSTTITRLKSLTITPTMTNYYVGNTSTPTSTVIGNLTDTITYTYQYDGSPTKPTVPGTYTLSVSATVANAENYAIIYNTSTFTVLPLIPLTITPTMANYAPGYPSTPTSTVIGDLTDTITYTYQYAESSTKPNVPGTYNLSVSATVANAEKYYITYNTSNFTVSEISYTIEGTTLVSVSPNDLGSYDLSSLAIDTIGAYVFQNFTNLTSVVFPTSLTTIGLGAFTGTGITDLDLSGTSIMELSWGTFNNSTLKTVNLSNTVNLDTIDYTFRNCPNLETLNLTGSSLTTLQNYAFSNCPKLATVLFPSELATIESGVFADCTILTSVVFPTSLTTIGGLAFSGTGIVDLDLSGTNITALSLGTFNNSTLQTVNLSNTLHLDTIEMTFNSCPNLVSVNLTGSKLTTLQNGVFSGCSKLTSVLLPSSLTTIEPYAFNDCTSLTLLDFPPSLTTIGENAFNNSGIIDFDLSGTSITELVTTYGNSIFDRSTLKSINLSNTVNLNTIENTFRNCPNLETVNLTGSSLTTLGTNAFSNCPKLNSVLFPASLTTIETDAFTDCTSLLSVKVSSAAVIQPGAFPSSTTITLLKLLTITPTMDDYYVGPPSTPTSTVIGNLTDTITYTYQYNRSSTIPTTPGTYTLSVIATVTNAENYAIIYNTSTFTALPISYTIEGNTLISATPDNSTLYDLSSLDITTIEPYAFSNFTNLISVVFPASLTTIGQYAFNGCINLISVSFPPSLTTIGENAFTGTGITDLDLSGTSITELNEFMADRSTLKTVNLSNTLLDTIGTTFQYCPNLESVNLTGSALTTIEPFAFSGCPKLKSVSFPASLTTIGENAFTGTGITDLDLSGTSITELNEFMADRSTLKTVNLSNTLLNTIGTTFQNCPNLESVNLTGSALTTIEPFAFSGCPKLKSVSFPASLNTIGGNAFTGTGITDLDLSGTSITELNEFMADRSTLKTVNLSNTLHLNTIGTTFQNCPNLESVNLTGSALTAIKPFAFYVSEKLTSVSFPASLTTIGGNAFTGTGITDLDLSGTNITELNEFMSDRSTLKTVNLSNTLHLNTIGTTFQNCPNLESINLTGSALTTIEPFAFYVSEKLTSVSFPASLTTIGGEAFTSNRITDLDLSGTSITTLNEFMFNSSTLKTVNLSNTLLNTIGITFQNCPNLESVNLTGSKLTTIPRFAFSNCPNLTSILFPSELATIQTDAFTDCTTLSSVLFPSELATIESGAFTGCTSLSSVEVLSTTDIQSGAFPTSTTIIRHLVPLTITPTMANYAPGYPSTPISTVVGNLKNTITYEYQYDGSSEIPTVPGTYTLSVTATGPNAANYDITYNTSTFMVSPITYNIQGDTLVSVTPNYLGSYDLSSLAITTINQGAFFNFVNLTSVVFPTSLTTIGQFAFNRCMNLTSVVFPPSLTTIGSEAFNNSGIIDLDLSGTSITELVTTYGNSIFNRSTLKSINLSNTVNLNTIENTFQNCPNLESVNLTGSKLTTITHSAFSNCPKLTTVLFPSELDTIEPYAFSGCTNLTSVLLPPSLASISENIFTESGITDVDLSGTKLTTIPRSAFSNCPKLTTVLFPSELDTIEPYAFSGCTKLTSMVFPASLTTIGDGVFSGAGITDIDLSGTSITTLNGNIFNPSTLKTVNLSNTLLDTLGYVFNGFPNLETVNLTGSKLTTLQNYVFSGCPKLTTVLLPDVLTTIESGVFYGCTSLTSIVLPPSLTSIGENAFTESGITDLDLSGTGITALTRPLLYPSALKSVNLSNTLHLDTLGSIFQFCSNLESVNLTGSKLTKIEGATFYGCTNLISVLFPSELATIETDAFNSCTNLASLVFPSKLDTIGERAFSNCTSLSSVEVLSTTVIGNEAFPTSTTIIRQPVPLTITPTMSDYYTGNPSTPTPTVVGNLKNTITYEYQYDGSSTIPTVPGTYTLSVTATGPNAANYTIIYNTSTFTVLPISYIIQGDTLVSAKPNDLSSYDLSSLAITTIGSLVFSNFTNLTTVVFPTSLTTIGSKAFAGTKIIDLDLSGTSITELRTSGVWSIFERSTLQTVNLSNTLHLDTIETTFQNCPNLVSVNLTGSKLTTIGTNAFYRCPKLTSVLFPSALATIQTNAFTYCTRLLSVKVPLATVIQSGAFPSSTTITRIKPLTITPTMADYYTGTPSTPSPTVIGDLTDTITYAYQYDGSSTIPTVPDTYTLSVTATGPNAANYTITYNTSTFTVLPLIPLTITPAMSNYVFVSPSTPTTTVIGNLTDTITYAYQYDGSSTIPTVPGIYTLSVIATVANAEKYTITYNTSTFTVLPLIPLTITPTMADYYTGSPSTPRPIVIGNLMDTITYEYKYNGNPTIPTVPGTYNLSVNAIVTNAEKYDINSNTSTFVVSPMPLTTVVTVPNYTIGSPSTPKPITDTLMTGHSITSYNYTYISPSTTYTSLPNVAGTFSATFLPTIKYGGQDVTSMYSFTPIETEFTVSKIPLTITAIVPNYSRGSSPIPNYEMVGLLTNHSITVHSTYEQHTMPSEPSLYTQHITSVTIMDELGNNVTSMYQRTFISCDFRVTIPITITSSMSNYRYGDVPTTANCITSETIEGTIIPTFKYGNSNEPPSTVGTYVLTQTVRIMYNGEDITSHYAITNMKSTFRVLPIKIILKAVMVDGVPDVIQTGELRQGDTLETNFKYGNSTEKPTTGSHIVSVKGKVKRDTLYVTSNYNIICHSCVYKA